MGFDIPKLWDLIVPSYGIWQSQPMGLQNPRGKPPDYNAVSHSQAMGFEIPSHGIYQSQAMGFISPKPWDLTVPSHGI